MERHLNYLLGLIEEIKDTICKVVYHKDSMSLQFKEGTDKVITLKNGNSSVYLPLPKENELGVYHEIVSPAIAKAIGKEVKISPKKPWELLIA